MPPGINGRTRVGDDQLQMFEDARLLAMARENRRSGRVDWSTEFRTAISAAILGAIQRESL